MILNVLRRARGDQRGATLIEFAIITPVMLTLIMGLSELTYQGYIQSILTGAVQKAGRDSSIQSNATQGAQIDSVVISKLAQLRSGWTQSCPIPATSTTPVYCSTRKSYSSFLTAGPEPFTDTAGTGVYDPTKDCFTDINNNGVWDADPGSNGQGGANDVTIYSMTIVYPRLFPVAGVVGMSSSASLTGTTVLKNQPYASQATYTSTQICPH